MPTPDLVNATDLAQWAQTRDAQGRLPQLVRRLVLATTRDVARVDVRSGDGVLYGGWDGIVESLTGSPFVPAGTSVWEMGTNQDPKAKAEEDYKKRTANPLHLHQADTAYVFVTPRRWSGKDDWVRAKQGEGKWREVRAYDADDLEMHLETAPTVHPWISSLLGKDPVATQDLETYWTDWAAATRPAISCDLVLGGRDETEKELIKGVAGPPDVIAIQGDSRDEALAFLAASIQRLPEADRDSLFARSIVVHEPGVWRRIIVSDKPLLLVPLFEGADAARAVQLGHTIVIPLGKESTARHPIALPRVRRSAAKEALQGMGLPEERADALATLARQSLLALRRKLAFSPEVQRPTWARPSEVRTAFPALLAGAWVGDRTQDQDALASLAGHPYHQVEQDMTRLAQMSDPPIRHIGSIWLLASKDDAWALLHQYLTSSDLQRFEEVAREVLGRNDAGGHATHSPILREGLADTLALMAIHHDALAGGATGSDRAARAIAAIFTAANADETSYHWASLSSVLPLLAEAAPDMFIDAVNAGLAGDDPVILRLFRDASERDLFLTGSPHTGLLWALENLAWNAEHLSRVALILARLTRLTSLPPQIGNRPNLSLRGIFLPWWPQTSASLDRRLAVLDVVQDREPSVSWDLLIRLLPHFHDASHQTHTPRWRDWQGDREPGVNDSEWRRGIHALAERALSAVGADGARWSDLINALANLPSDVRNKMIERLFALAPDVFAGEARTAVRDALRSVVSHHRRFSDAQWAMPTVDVDRLAEAYRLLEPDDEIERHVWLFADRVDLPDGGNDQEPWDHRGAVDKARDQVVRDIYGRGGLETVRDLAAAVDRPADVGWIIGHIGVSDSTEQDIFTDLASSDLVRRLLARGYVNGRFRADGWEWATAVLGSAATSWSPVQRGAFLLCLDASTLTFDWVTRFGDETQRAYWSLFGGFSLASPDAAVQAATNLIIYERAYAAVDVLALYVSQVVIDPELVAQALERAAESMSGDGIDREGVTYNVVVLLDYLAAADTVDETRLARLEWIYLPLLRDRRPAQLLHRQLAQEPIFFVEVVSLVLRAEGDDPSGPAEESALWGAYGYHLLKTWQLVPGHHDDGRLDADALGSWVRQARQLLAASGRFAIGDQMIGHVLRYGPPVADGIWPDVAIRNVIEEIGSDNVELGIQIEVLNSLGASYRGLTDGGAQERSLVSRYTAYADAVTDRWPRTAAVMRRIARTFEGRGRQEDTTAELAEDTWR